MRIAGGVLLLLIGIFSLVEGGCVAIGCHAAGKVADGLGAMGTALQNKTATTEDVKKAAEAAGASLEELKGSATNLGIVSIIIRLAGLLCIVAGILFFVNKAKIFGFLAPGIGIIGEILLFVMMAFTVIGLVKILIYAFGLFAATKVGEQSS